MISQRITCEGPADPDMLIVVGKTQDPMGYALTPDARRWLYGLGMPDGIFAFDIECLPEKFFRKVPAHLNIVIHWIDENLHRVVTATDNPVNICSGGLAHEPRVC